MVEEVKETTSIEMKEAMEKEERERRNYILLRKIYEMVLNMQCDIDMLRKDKQITKSQEEMERLKKEINYLEEDKRYIQKRKYDMLEERY